MERLTLLPPTQVSSSFPDLAAEPLTAGCGVSKGCLLYPSTCTGDQDCSHVVTYRPNPADPQNRIDFQLKSRADGYVSLGFSRDRLMVSIQL